MPCVELHRVSPSARQSATAQCVSIELCICAGARYSVSITVAAELRTLAGKTVLADLVSLSDKEIVLRGDSGPMKTPLADVLYLDLQSIGQRPVQIQNRHIWDVF